MTANKKPAPKTAERTVSPAAAKAVATVAMKRRGKVMQVPLAEVNAFKGGGWEKA